MRSTLHGPETFLLKSRKPHIVALVERCKTLSEEEIRALPEKPDIIKGLLGIRRLADQQRAASLAERLADMMVARHIENNGEVAREQDAVHRHGHARRERGSSMG